MRCASREGRLDSHFQRDVTRAPLSGLVIHTDNRFSVFLWTGRGKSGGWVSSIDIRSGLLDGFVRMADSEAINLPIRTKLSVCLHPPLARQTVVRPQLRYRFGGGMP